MSEKEIQSEPDELEAEDLVKEKSNFPIFPIVVVISLVLAIAAASGVGIGWLKMDQQQLQQAQTIKSLNSKIESLQQNQQVNKNISTTMQSALNKQQQEITQQLTQITEKLGRNRHDWAVSEIRYTLRQANMRLQLFKDKSTALVALNIADAQLAKLADPSLHKVRGIVNKEIAALRAIKDLDVEGVSLRLSALAEQVNNLEVSVTSRNEISDPNKLPLLSSANELADWEKHADAIWSELKTLVTIRRTDKKILPLLSEQELQQLRQALGLKFEIARLALLERNTSLFHASVQAANDWLEEYFNDEQSAVLAIKKELKLLMLLQLKPKYPEISGSLAMLEQLQTVKKDIPKSTGKIKTPQSKKPIKNERVNIKEKPAQ